MSQHTRTFNIGEYMIGGRLQVHISGKVIKVKCLDWSTSKEVPGFKLMVVTSDRKAYTTLDSFLLEATTPYYTEQVMEWIKSKIRFEN